VVDPDLGLGGNGGFRVQRHTRACAFQHTEIIRPVPDRKDVRGRNAQTCHEVVQCLDLGCATQNAP
jgi:hypothetical protein